MKNRSILTILSLIILLGVTFYAIFPKSDFNVKAIEAIPDTPEARKIMKTIEKAYAIEAEAAYKLKIEKFDTVFINDPRFPLDEWTLQTVRELTSNPSLESAGWLDYKMAMYSWRIEATIKKEKIEEKAKSENRGLTKEEKLSLIDENGRIAPSRSQSQTKIKPIIFISIEIHNDVATVVLDDGTYIAELYLVLVDGKWYIAGFQGISIKA